jgi:hypothetical protein
VVRRDIVSAVPSRLESSHTARRFVPSGIELVLELSRRGFDILELLQQFGSAPHRPSLAAGEPAEFSPCRVSWPGCVRAPNGLLLQLSTLCEP